MTDDLTLSLSTATAIIHAPIERINIADWVLHLPDAEYQRCSTAHIAAGSSTSDDGRAMSMWKRLVMRWWSSTTSRKSGSRTSAGWSQFPILSRLPVAQSCRWSGN